MPAGQKINRKKFRFTANGVQSLNLGFAVKTIAITAYGEGGSPSAWDVDVDGKPWDEAGVTAVEIDGHNSGVESLGQTVNASPTGIVTSIAVELASLNLNGATALIVDVVAVGHP